MLALAKTLLDRFCADEAELITNENSGYENFGQDECLLVFESPLKEQTRLYCYLMNHRATLIFGDWSCHFDYNEHSVAELMEDMDLILNHEAYVLTVSSRAFILSILCHGNKMLLSSDAHLKMVQLFQNTDFLHDATTGRVSFDLLYWDQPPEIGQNLLKKLLDPAEQPA